MHSCIKGTNGVIQFKVQMLLSNTRYLDHLGVTKMTHLQVAISYSQQL
jgi:hypothetical protein